MDEDGETVVPKEMVAEVELILQASVGAGLREIEELALGIGGVAGGFEFEQVFPGGDCLSFACPPAEVGLGRPGIEGIVKVVRVVDDDGCGQMDEDVVVEPRSGDCSKFDGTQNQRR